MLRAKFATNAAEISVEVVGQTVGTQEGRGLPHIGAGITLDCVPPPVRLTDASRLPENLVVSGEHSRPVSTGWTTFVQTAKAADHRLCWAPFEIASIPKMWRKTGHDRAFWARDGWATPLSRRIWRLFHGGTCAPPSKAVLPSGWGAAAEGEQKGRLKG